MDHKALLKVAQSFNSLVSVDSFDFLLVIGEGGFSKVWKAQYKKLRKYIAIKEMSKIKIIEKNVLNNILSEKELLSTLQEYYIRTFPHE